MKYVDVPGFCKSATLDVIREQQWVLTPGRYVGTDEEEEDDAEIFEENMNRLTSELAVQIKLSRNLESEIRKNLESIGFNICER